MTNRPIKEPWSSYNEPNSWILKVFSKTPIRQLLFDFFVYVHFTSYKECNRCLIYKNTSFHENTNSSKKQKKKLDAAVSLNYRFSVISNFCQLFQVSCLQKAAHLIKNAWSFREHKKLKGYGHFAMTKTNCWRFLRQ